MIRYYEIRCQIDAYYLCLLFIPSSIPNSALMVPLPTKPATIEEKMSITEDHNINYSGLKIHDNQQRRRRENRNISNVKGSLGHWHLLQPQHTLIELWRSLKRRCIIFACRNLSPWTFVPKQLRVLTGLWSKHCIWRTLFSFLWLWLQPRTAWLAPVFLVDVDLLGIPTAIFRVVEGGGWNLKIGLVFCNLSNSYGSLLLREIY